MKKLQIDSNKRKLLKVLILLFSCLFISEYANAGAIRVVKETVEISGGNKHIFKPNSQISVSFDIENYTFASHKYGYMIFILIPINSKNVKKLFYTLISLPTPGSQGLHHITMNFNAPLQPGQYRLVYNEIPIFRSTKITSHELFGKSIEAHGKTRQVLEHKIRKFSNHFKQLTQFNVSEKVLSEDSLTIYLRHNGKIPLMENISGGGIVDKPLELSWYVGNEFKLNREHVLFRYKIFPIDKEWSAWTRQTSVKYHFLPRGTLNFRVQAKYNDSKKSFMSQTAKFNFVLTEHFVAKADAKTLFKSPTSKPYTNAGKVVETNIAFDEVYKKSYALLIGIHKFDDKLNFKEFPSEKIKRDVDTLEKALEANGFIVTKLFKDRLDRDEIVTAMADLVDKSSENDRLFIYFSTHGFPDRNAPSDAYLATSNCNFFKPTVNCLPLAAIEKEANRALTGKKVRQVLIAVDSCFSGLGVISKAAGVPDYSKLAAVHGAYMLTAGMEDQQAEIDPKLEMSTFTHFLSEGLKGKANMFDKNGIITLTELFLYTQYNVARQSNSRQIPMLGRLRGSGEMLFKPVQSKKQEGL